MRTCGVALPGNNVVRRLQPYAGAEVPRAISQVYHSVIGCIRLDTIQDLYEARMSESVCSRRRILERAPQKGFLAVTCADRDAQKGAGRSCMCMEAGSRVTSTMPAGVLASAHLPFAEVWRAAQAAMWALLTVEGAHPERAILPHPSI